MKLRQLCECNHCHPYRRLEHAEREYERAVQEYVKAKQAWWLHVEAYTSKEAA